MNRFTLQLHITDKCNLRCKHCYSNEWEKELHIDQFLLIIKQYKELLKKISKKESTKVHGHINLAGGEPLLNNSIFDMLKVIREHNLSFGILTNGTKIDSEIAKRLKQFAPSYIQVSLEGGGSMNDSIRSKGAFQKTLNAITNLKKNGIRCIVSFTASTLNYKEFPKAVRAARKAGAEKIWADRYIPTTEEDLKYVLSKEETKDFFHIMHKEQKKIINKILRFDVSMNRALQFLISDSPIYSCNAGKGLLNIMPDGTLYPCRRMPINCGNIFDTPLTSLYYESCTLQELRDFNNCINGCENCMFEKFCNGGLKCLSYSINQNSYVKDPGCFIN